MASELFIRVGTFAAARYNAFPSDVRDEQGWGYMGILIKIRHGAEGAIDPDKALLDYLNMPHTDPRDAKACKLVLEQLGPVS